MTEEGQAREDRRRTRSAFGAFGLLALSAALGAEERSIVPLIGLVVLLFLVWCGFAFFVARDGRAEARRRADGAAPSWPAQLPVAAARLMGASGRHSRQPENGELFGRVSLVDGGFRWEPRAGDRKRGVRALEWDRSWSAEVVPVWGPGRQGCLTLTRADGLAVDLWVRHPEDLRRALR